MKVNVRELHGSWDKGFALDKHVLSSTYLGDNEYGRPQFDTTRSEAGEALFRLKYRNDWSQVGPIAAALADSIVPRLGEFSLIVPMPASNHRARQPVTEIATELGKLIGRPVFENILVKNATPQGAAQLKDLGTREEKQAALNGRFAIHDEIAEDGRWNCLVVDDLYDTGASMDAAVTALRSYSKMSSIFVASVSWK